MSDPEIQQLFDEALTVPQVDQAAYLDRACAQRPDLRREVEELLRHHAAGEAESFLEDHVYRFPTASDEDDLTNRRLGPYQVGELLGRGGMGAVYRAARVEDFRKEVALKVAHAGSAHELNGRLHAERQLLASLDHPGIARLLDGGCTSDGRPYFVMELIDGSRIDDHCHTTHADYRTRARLVREAALAVAYAHERGVIHRDLKPGNLLVTRDGQLRVVDFGLARQRTPEAEGESLTPTGACLGTPSYMAPEQAQGRARGATAAADVYALGAVLYKLLVGRPPFWSPSPVATLRQVVDEEPVPPARLAADVPHDLETICLKCLEKDPHRRYGSARELADDLERFQDGTPIRGRRVGPVERLVRWSRRHPRTAALSAAFVLLGVSSFVTITGLWRATVSSETELRKRHRVALNVLRRYIDAVNSRLSVAHPLTKEEKAAHLQALESYEALLAEDARDPATREQAALAYDEVGNLLRKIGDHEGAERLFGKAVALFAHLTSEFPEEPEHQHHLACSCSRHGGTLLQLGRKDEAIAVLTRAAAEARAAVARCPDNDRYRAELQVALEDLANRHRDAGRLDEAETLFKEALASASELASKHSYAWQHQVRRLGCVNALAGLAARSGTLGPLIDSCRLRAGLCEEFAGRYPDEPHACAELCCHTPLAAMLVLRGERKEADEVFRRGLGLEQQLARRFPTIRDYRRRLANDLRQAGLFWWATDREGAVQALRQSKAEYLTLIRDHPETRPDHERNLALLTAMSPDRSPADLEEAITLAQGALGRAENDPFTHFVLGQIHFRRGHWQKSLAALRETQAHPNEVGMACKLEADLFALLARFHLGERDAATREFPALRQALLQQTDLQLHVHRLLAEAEQQLGDRSAKAAP